MSPRESGSNRADELEDSDVADGGGDVRRFEMATVVRGPVTAWTTPGRQWRKPRS